MRAGPSIFLLLMLSCRSTAFAHLANISYSMLVVHERSISCELMMSLAELPYAAELDSDGDRFVSNAEVQQQADRIFATIRENFKVLNNGRAGEFRPIAIRVDEASGDFYAQFELSFSEATRQMSLRCDLPSVANPNHTHLAKIEGGGAIQQAILNADKREFNFVIYRGLRGFLAQCSRFVLLGVEHIFMGYDHILFVIGLLLVASTLINLVKIVTSFTVAHSITLIVATLGVIKLPTRFVESAIALSVAYIAIENLLVKDTRNRWMISFLFGLIHGFGFSNILRQMGLPRQNLVASLLSFNVGVEIGQLAIISVVFPLILYVARFRWHRLTLTVSSLVIMAFGLVWFFQRAFG